MLTTTNGSCSCFVLYSSEPVVVKEGEETERFWASVGGQEKYHTGPKQVSLF